MVQEQLKQAVGQLERKIEEQHSEQQAKDSEMAEVREQLWRGAEEQGRVAGSLEEQVRGLEARVQGMAGEMREREEQVAAGAARLEALEAEREREREAGREREAAMEQRHLLELQGKARRWEREAAALKGELARSVAALEADLDTAARQVPLDPKPSILNP